MSTATADLTGLGSISPLPEDYRRSLVIMAVLGTVSLASSSILWLHITYKLCTWKLRQNSEQRRERERGREGNKQPETRQEEVEVDLNLGLTEDHYRQAKRMGGNQPRSASVAPSTNTNHSARDNSAVRSPSRHKPPNPLLIMIYNLLLADITLSACYMGSYRWLGIDAILVPSWTCKFQGWTVSFSLETTSAFLCAMSIYTYLSIVKGYKPGTRIILVTIFTIWIAAIVLSCLGPLLNDSDEFYARHLLGVCCQSQPQPQSFFSRLTRSDNPIWDAVLDQLQVRVVAPGRLRVGILLHRRRPDLLPDDLLRALG
jgi:hypothetical protein